MEKKTNHWVRDTHMAQWEIDVGGDFKGENILRVDAPNGLLRFQYITLFNVISTAELSIEEIFHYLPMILKHMNDQAAIKMGADHAN